MSEWIARGILKELNSCHIIEMVTFTLEIFLNTWVTELCKRCFCILEEKSQGGLVIIRTDLMTMKKIEIKHQN